MTFDERAPEWDTPERQERARAVADLIRAAVPLDGSMRAIEIGAGTGLLGLELRADVASMTLSDPSSGMIGVARDKIAAGRFANAQAIVYDVPGPPPPGAPYDLVISLMALHHVADTAATLRSIHDMLAPDGWLALLDLEAEDGSFHDPDAQDLHHHGFDPDALVRAAEAAGLVEVTSRTTIEVERDGRPYPLFLLTGRRG